MAVKDLDARFDTVAAEPGTLAHVAREAIREAAKTIDTAAGGSESSEVTTVIQQLEVAAHQAGRYLQYPARPEEPEVADDGSPPDDA